MSWGANLKYKDGKFETVQKSGVTTAEHDEQYAAALQTSQDIIESGAVGSGTFTVTVSGHGNRHHEPADGWANDFVQITVIQE